MTNIDLRKYGFPAALLPQSGSLAPARVTAVFKDRWQLITPQGERFGQLKTKEYFYEEGAVFPTTGDFVLAAPACGDWQIVKTLPRKSFFSRMDSWHGVQQAVAANMDLVFMVQSLNQDFSVKRLERYLSQALNSGAKPVILLTKADLLGDHQEKLALAQAVGGETPVLAVSAKTGYGFAELEAMLPPGSTAAFLGSSGVGKSSVINRLAGEEVMSTGGIRQRDGKGRHTTSHRQLLLLAGGALVIDTPGMRELGMWDAAQGVSTAFPDVEAFLGQCRFSDCKHEKEPGCAIRMALERGELSWERWKSYQRLMSESGLGRRKKRGQPSKALAKQRRKIKDSLDF